MQKNDTEKKYLVFSSVGDENCVHYWLSEPEQKNFDLVVYYYGDRQIPEFTADLVIKRKGLKYENFYHYLSSVEYGDYDAIWVVDDDIVMNTSSINKMFTVFSEYDLWLAQPSYQTDSRIHWPITQQRPGNVLRFTNFVENGVALFSKTVIDQFRETFQNARSGCGIDLIWPVLLEFPKDKIAVLDIVACFHPQTQKSSLDKVIPRSLHLVQAVELLKEYGILPAHISNLAPWNEVYELLPFVVREFESVKLQSGMTKG